MTLRRKIAVVASAMCLAASLVTPASAETVIVHTTDPNLAASCEKQVGPVFENGSWTLIYQNGTCTLAVDPPEPGYCDTNC